MMSAQAKGEGALYSVAVVLHAEAEEVCDDGEGRRRSPAAGRARLIRLACRHAVLLRLTSSVRGGRLGRLACLCQHSYELRDVPLVEELKEGVLLCGLLLAAEGIVTSAHVLVLYSALL